MYSYFFQSFTLAASFKPYLKPKKKAWKNLKPKNVGAMDRIF